MPVRFVLIVILFSLFTVTRIVAQVFPIPVASGFNEDVIAEAGPSSFATTSRALDAPGSNKVMYTTNFAAFAGIPAGLPHGNPTQIISSGGDQYEIGPFAGNNALCLFQGQSQDLILVPIGFQGYSKIKILCFSTEGPSTVNVSLGFADGSSTAYISNYVLPDWFYGTSNIVVQGFGRCSRTATGPWTPDGLPSNPKLYYIEIDLNCVDRQKTLSKISLSNVSSSPNAPFPNAVFLAVSGTRYVNYIIPTIVPSDCSGPNGSISLNVTGSSGPFTYSWNTNPVQTGPTATGLAPGTYSCTITDASGCIITPIYTGTVPLNNNAAMTASANPVSICPGGSAQLSAAVTTGNLTTFTWTPGNLSGQTVTVTPGSTTIYTVNGTNTIGCTASAQVTVTVMTAPSAPIVNSMTICAGSTATLQVQSPQPGFTYKWYDAATGGILLATGASYTTPPMFSTFTFHVEATNGSGCISSSRTPVTVTVNNLPAAPSANAATICSGSDAVLAVSNPQPGFTYNWYSVSTGGSPVGTGTTFTVSNVTANVTYYVEAVSSAGCISITRTPVSVTLLQPLPAPVVTLTNASFTSLTFSWNAVPGATGYQVTMDGGLNFQIPSSGVTGTTHTITGLSGNQTVTVQVRALGPQACENSALSAAIPGTTLSSKEIFVPNVFTPNNDGKNDVLLVYGNYIASMQFYIFNQWGELVFSSTSQGSGWNGSYKGKQQPVAVYSYTLKVTRQDGTVVNKKGSISLIR